MIIRKNRLKVLLGIILLLFLAVGCNKSYKEYHPGGALKFEGVKKDNLAEGLGTSYYENGNVEYEGNWSRNYPHGEGKSYHENGKLKYEGQWNFGHKTGQGIEYHANGIVAYNGTYVEDKRAGFGTSFYHNGEMEYKGGWDNDLFNGEGKYYEINDYNYTFTVFDGEFLDGKASGYGTLTFHATDDNFYKKEGLFNDFQSVNVSNEIIRFLTDDVSYIINKYDIMEGLDIEGYKDGFMKIGLGGYDYCDILYLKDDKTFIELHKEFTLPYGEGSGGRDLSDINLLETVLKKIGIHRSIARGGTYEIEDNKLILYGSKKRSNSDEDFSLILEVDNVNKEEYLIDGNALLGIDSQMYRIGHFRDKKNITTQLETSNRVSETTGKKESKQKQTKYKDLFEFYSDDNGLYGFLDINGKIVIEPQYINANSFSEGLAVVKNEDYMDGYINVSNDLVIEYKFYIAGDFSEGMAYYGIYDGYDTKYGYINNKGEIIVEAKYLSAGDFSEGLAPVYDEAFEGWGYINNGGEMVISPRFKTIVGHPISDYGKDGLFSEGLANVSYNNKSVYINKEGEVVLEPVYESVGPFLEGLASFYDSKTNKYGYFNKKLKIIIPPMFDYAGTFNNGYAAVGIGNEDSMRYHFINKDGSNVFKMDFDYLDNYKNGLAKFRDEDTEIGYINGYINTKGEIVYQEQINYMSGD